MSEIASEKQLNALNEARLESMQEQKAMMTELCQSKIKAHKSKMMNEAEFNQKIGDMEREMAQQVASMSSQVQSDIIEARRQRQFRDIHSVEAKVKQFFPALTEPTLLRMLKRAERARDALREIDAEPNNNQLGLALTAFHTLLTQKMKGRL